MTPVRRAFLMAAFEQYAGILINFVAIAILARLLSPAEIGIAVIGLAITTITFSLREFATSEFLVQLHTVERSDIHTAFTVALATGLLLSVGLLVAAPLLAGIYDVAGLPLFLMFAVLASLIETASMPAVAMLRREMAFGRLAGARAAGSMITAAVTIGIAAAGYGFMSYAIGMLAGSIIATTIIISLDPGSVPLRPTLASWRKMVDFGRYKGATVVIARIYESLPQLFLGTVMPKDAVGIYNRASTVVGIPDRIILSSVFSVSFPMLATEVRAGKDIKSSYLGALSYIAVLYWPGVLLIAILAKPVVAIVLGSQWDAAVPIVRIMAIASVFWFPVILTGPLLMTLGANREAFTSDFVSRSCAAIVLCSASFFGLTAMALSQLINQPFQMYVALRYVKRHVAFRWVDLVIEVRASAAVTALCIVGPLAIVSRAGFHSDLGLLDLVVAGVLALVGWLFGLVVTRHPFLKEVAAVLDAFGNTFPIAASALSRLRTVAVRSDG